MSLAARLRERRHEIEQATLARVRAVSDPDAAEDPEYVLGVRATVVAALEYAMAALDTAPGEPRPVPEQLLSQARAAVRNGVALDTVLRRYSVGYTLLCDYLIEEAERESSVSAAQLRQALRAETSVYDHLIATVSREYARESEARAGSSERRRAELVKMLLAGKPVDPGQLRYSFEAWHVAALAAGPGASETWRELAMKLDRQLLLVQAEEDVVWAWLGGRSRLDPCRLLDSVETSLPPEALLALGEPGQGSEGWRRSHRQARAAMPIAQRGAEHRVRYADVALLASALCDDLLASSLHDLYIAPLEAEREGGVALRETLQAYLTAGRNVSSAAAVLGVARQTVSIRLRTVEERVGRALDSCAAEIEVALALRGLRGPTDRHLVR
jgi:hypothetical protein